MANEEPNGGFPYLPSGAAEVDRLIKENSDLFSDAQCKVCSAVLISDSQKLAHYQSKKHANKVRRYMYIHKDDNPLVKRLKVSTTEEPETINSGGDRLKACHICNMTFYTPVIAESHYQGKVHAKNLKLRMGTPTIPQPVLPQAKIQDQAKMDGPKQEVGPAPEGTMDDRSCSLCNATFNNPLMAQQHYVGKKHQKQMAKPKASQAQGTATVLKGYPCKVCNIELNSQKQYDAHISGSKHKNQVKLASGSQAPEVTPSEDSTLPPVVSEWNSKPEAAIDGFQE
ncbi:zinc finger protein 346 isoform X1 [Alosa pseudoharengus]|uniref:zinc finger protein 346 isoform X1 n=2 Tax=Alosa pseudoharengus TaxID=34774 RepID=UPI003F8C04BC